MDETLCYAVWILTLLLYLILIVIFSHTTCVIKHSCQKQLSDDRQRSLVACTHFRNTAKRAVCIIQIGFLEVCAGLVIVMEATAVQFDIVRNQPGKEEHCSEYYQRAGRLHYISCAIVGCLFLSIVRCIAQRYVLQRLWKSDVVSMTKIYLVPATFFVTTLCVWSWFRLYEDPERKQAEQIVHCHVVRPSPLNSLWLILIPIFWNLVIDYLEYRAAGESGFTTKYIGCEASPVDDGFKYNNTSLKETNLIADVVLSQEHPGHAVSKTTCSITRNDKEIAIIKPTLLADAILPARNSEIAMGAQYVELTDKAPVQSWFDSFRAFLNIYTRIYLALVFYLTAMIGVYTFLSNCHAFPGMEDFINVVFITLLVISGLLRALQVTSAEVENRLKCEKMCEINV